jgi:hypothetical protein
MRANFHELSSETRISLVTNFERISNMMNEQEVCSSLHGLAKMDGRWYDLPEVLRRSILNCTLRRMEIGILYRMFMTNCFFHKTISSSCCLYDELSKIYHVSSLDNLSTFLKNIHSSFITFLLHNKAQQYIYYLHI